MLKITKLGILTVGFIGVGSSILASLFGGFTSSFETLFILMIVDFLTGLILAGIFHLSPKSKNGALSSNTLTKGIFKKIAMLILIIIGNRIDIEISTSYVRNAIIFSLIAEETISIIENLGLIGLPMPNVITKAIDILKNRGGV